MSYRVLPWQQEQWRTVVQWWRTERWPQAVMLCGPPSVGKRSFAAALVATALCQQPDAEGQACDKCRGCTLRAAGSHPDFMQITCPEGKKSIGIDDIRELIAQLSLTSSIASRKVATIDPAQAMTVAAANSLLKTLEEPPGETVIILVAEQISRMPKTILSRCQRLAFPQPDTQIATRWLQDQTTQGRAVDDALKWAHGNPVLALDYLTETRTRQDLLPSFRALVSHSLSPVQIAKEWQTLGMDYVTDWLLRACTEIVKLKVITNRGGDLAERTTESMQDLANQLDLFRLFELVDEIHLQRGRYLMHGGLNELLGLESLAIQFARAGGSRASI